MDFQFNYDDNKTYDENFEDWYRLNTDEKSYERKLGFKEKNYTTEQAKYVFRKLWGNKLEIHKQTFYSIRNSKSNT